jgi:hypothetical protein
MAARVIVVLGLALLTSCAKAPAPPPPAASAPAAPAAAQPIVSASSSYEVKEKCARDARDWYKHTWEDARTPAGTQALSSYTNHYNARLGQCFILVDGWTISKDKKPGKAVSREQKTLTDVLENRDVAVFDLLSDGQDKQLAQCNVNGTPCSSRDGWDALTRQYMEE